MGDCGAIDPAELRGKQDQIRELMRRDPRFIGRLITQLDSQMHKMMLEKQQRLLAVKEDTEAITKLDHTINSHIHPNLERLSAQLAQRRQVRDALQRQLEEEARGFRELDAAAAALVSKARHASGKLMGQTASNSLRDARGFCTTTPTTHIINGGRRKAPG